MEDGVVWSETKAVPAWICKAATLNAWKGDKKKQMD